MYTPQGQSLEIPMGWEVQKAEKEESRGGCVCGAGGGGVMDGMDIFWNNTSKIKNVIKSIRLHCEMS